VLEKMEAAIERRLTATRWRVWQASARGISTGFFMRTRAWASWNLSRHSPRYARRLLMQSPLSLSEIAYATGFSSPSHFSNAFKQAFDESPGHMRRRIALAAKRARLKTIATSIWRGHVIEDQKTEPAPCLIRIRMLSAIPKENNLEMAIGHEVRAYRKKLGITVTDLAAATGVSSGCCRRSRMAISHRP
jgi:hypothetical protein